METGNRSRIVNIKPSTQDEYDRIRPQGGRCFRAVQPLGGEYCRNFGERDGGAGELSERRGCASSAKSFLEGLTNRGGETVVVCGLSGNAAQEFLNGRTAERSCKVANRTVRMGALARLLCISFLLLLNIVINGCGHKSTQAQIPPAPSPPQEKPAVNVPSTETPGAADEKIDVPADAKPIFEETGIASWYGAPYHNRRGSNGEVYNMHAMTAAHLSLPLGSIVRITNLKTGHMALVRITDRGPFIPGRILDLSLAAARKLDVYRPGIAEVKAEVMETPAPLDSGGKWAVQIGSFPDESVAIEFADHLTRR